MTRVVIAAGVNNELGSSDISAVRRLRQAGYDIQFYYYLPRVPAEFTMLPSVNEEIKNWRTQGRKTLNEVGNQLDIAKNDRHFVDEVLGPDRIFDEAKELNADIILTKNLVQLKQSILSKFYDKLIAFFKGKKEKEIPVENVDKFATQVLGTLREVKKEEKLQAINDERIRSEALHKKRAS